MTHQKSTSLPITPVLLPLTPEMAEELKRMLGRATREGHGHIEITVTPNMIRIVDTIERRFAWV